MIKQENLIKQADELGIIIKRRTRNEYYERLIPSETLTKGKMVWKNKRIVEKKIDYVIFAENPNFSKWSRQKVAQAQDDYYNRCSYDDIAAWWYNLNENEVWDVVQKLIKHKS